MFPTRARMVGAALALVLAAAPGAVGQEMDAVEIVAQPLADGVHMLAGRGGNIGVSSGPDGVVLIDDQYAPLTDKIRAAVARISDGPIRFVVNTHWHGDHTGGNENLGRTGSLVVAHDNVRQRMSVEQVLEAFSRQVPASPPGALPLVTFSETVTFHLNGGEVHVFHVPRAHTDGDAIVHFRDANVIHLGDVFWSGMYPFIDVGTGGTIDGIIAASRRALALCDDKTRLIPGHGPASGRAELEAYVTMLETVRGRVAALVAEGKSLEECAAARPTADLDETWGQGFIKGDQIVAFAHQSLAASR